MEVASSSRRELTLWPFCCVEQVDVPILGYEALGEHRSAPGDSSIPKQVHHRRTPSTRDVLAGHFGGCWQLLAVDGKALAGWQRIEHRILESCRWSFSQPHAPAESGGDSVAKRTMRLALRVLPTFRHQTIVNVVLSSLVYALFSGSRGRRRPYIPDEFRVAARAAIRFLYNRAPVAHRVLFGDAVAVPRRRRQLGT